MKETPEQKKSVYPEYLSGKGKKTCYGCLACAAMCPTHAIEYKADEDGYYYPYINSKLCIKCGKCSRVCPNELSEKIMKTPHSSFAGMINDNSDFYKSSSGGAFKAIVKACVKQFSGKYKKIFCAGVKFDDDFQVLNDVTRITTDESVDVFSKSKYVQSNPINVWSKCISVLKDKQNFLIFTGTPCQVAAMVKIVDRLGGADNILTIDLICHGAPSQFQFDSYRRSIENEYQSKLVFYEFRTKDVLDNGTTYTRSAKYRFENGVEKRVNRLEDPYLIDFYNDSFASRPSCDHCFFKRPDRCSDITIGDAWRINMVYPELTPTAGVSVVISSSDKTKEFTAAIRQEMKVYELDYEFIKNNNEPLKQI